MLLGLYIATLVVALAGGEGFFPMLQACIVATIAVPVIIHLFMVMKNVRDGGSVFDNPYSYRNEPEEKDRDKDKDKDSSG